MVGIDMNENIDYIIAARKIQGIGTYIDKLGLRICQVDRVTGLILNESPEWITNFSYPDSDSDKLLEFPSYRIKNLTNTTLDVCWYEDLIKCVPGIKHQNQSKNIVDATALLIDGGVTVLFPSEEVLNCLPIRGEVESDDIGDIYQEFDKVSQTVDSTTMTTKKSKYNGKTITISE